MVHPLYVAKVLKHKQALLFAGGVAVAVVGKKILESETIKDAATDTLATVMSLKRDAEERMEEIKQEAEAKANGEE